ncbi:NAD(P)/FAD-dependent oxidoreductase [Novosphingobium pentaromativorans]|uniref:FAD dependent oxidoreductase n=1 Tax=Novosphingobium pentaromativorans US6-1 TaxID=1088721 RepID=G6EFX8_9SPHN|nr:FAD-binding oxidoreductase [Novosphingobium pentaromativorans]AIT82323.1 D-amino acid oxidase [Novosphingobium pentaromativorans US6-1]EHJ59666.1 FAD dependent oxidoreductase [Novosphingobium pentaromativorans US6-1]
MSPVVERIHSDEKLPAVADVVIVGAGIVGSATAYYLAKRGLSVALIEKGNVGCEQSSRNWGWCRQQNRDAREMPLSLLSMHLWDELAGEIGKDLGFRRCGLVYATDDEKMLAGWESWRPVAKEFGVNTRMLSAAEAADRMPTTRRNWVGGLHSADDGKAEPALAAPVLAEGARALGATIHQECAARALDIANGRVVGVHTEKGTIRTNAVLCAAGAWASRFVRTHGVSFPQASVRQTALRTKPTVNVGDVLYSPDFAMTRRLDGSYTLAISGRAVLELTPKGIRYAREFMPQFIQRLKAVQVGLGKSFLTGPDSAAALLFNDDKIFEKTRVLDPEPLGRQVRQIMHNVRSTFPQLANIEIDSAWGAFVDCTPDAVPVISQVDKVDGLVLAAGCSGHGFGVGPGIGYLAAQLIVNDTPSIDPTPFRLSRLVDGSKVEVGAL